MEKIWEERCGSSFVSCPQLSQIFKKRGVEKEPLVFWGQREKICVLLIPPGVTVFSSFFSDLCGFGHVNNKAERL